MRPGLRQGLELLWRRQAELARAAHALQRTEAARWAAVAAWSAVDELTKVLSDESTRQALRRAARHRIPRVSSSSSR